MMGKIKLIVILAVSVASFVVYSFLFVTILGVDKADAVSILTTGKLKNLPQPEDALSDSARAAAEDSAAAVISMVDSLAREIQTIQIERAELESLKLEMKSIIISRDKQEEERLTGLAKIYDGMDPGQLATIMAGLDNPTVVNVISKMKSQKVSKILESMPPERAAQISAMMLGKK